MIVVKEIYRGRPETDISQHSHQDARLSITTDAVHVRRHQYAICIAGAPALTIYVYVHVRGVLVGGGGGRNHFCVRSKATDIHVNMYSNS